jgi:cell cycle protein kinase DBF2
MEWKLHCAKESAYLRKRRCRTNTSQFQLLAQIGQGGYGQVFLARKKDTKEVCALKKMNKKLLQKMNEIQHILNERDVLTQARSEWLVKLLYSFQDFDHVYLAMVSFCEQGFKN